MKGDKNKIGEQFRPKGVPKHVCLCVTCGMSFAKERLLIEMHYDKIVADAKAEVKRNLRTKHKVEIDVLTKKNAALSAITESKEKEVVSQRKIIKAFADHMNQDE